MTSDAIDAILLEFRSWLQNLIHSPAGAAPESGSNTIDLFTLIGQFTALRHEVNMQTKAARQAVEQNAAVLKQLESTEHEDDSERLRPIVKSIIDITDALTLSLRQMEKLRDTLIALLDEQTNENETDHGENTGRESEGVAPAPAPGFWARLWSRAPQPAAMHENQPLGTTTVVKQSLDFDRLQSLAAAAADGYSMSLRRVERLLPILDLEPLEFTGSTFDPDWMEAVEVVSDGSTLSGRVIEDVRPGYRWRGKLLRYAQVKVAR